MVSNWIDAIVVSRNQQRHFNVYARKYAETMDTAASRRWLTLDSTIGLKDPSTLLAAINAAAEELDLELDFDLWYTIVYESRQRLTLDKPFLLVIVHHPATHLVKGLPIIWHAFAFDFEGRRHKVTKGICA